MKRSARHVAPLWRRVVLLSLFVTAALGMVARAGYLQVVHKDTLKREGAARYLRIETIPAHRGELLDRNGEPLAISTPVDSVWAEPAVLMKQQARLPELAAALRLEPAALEQRIRGREASRFAYLRRQLRPEEATAVSALGVEGVHLQREYARYYPAAEVTSQLLGYTDIDDVGQEGLELAFDQWLKARPGSKRVLRDRFGNTIKDVASISVPVPGRDLWLSIDSRIQYLAYRAVKAAVLRNRARGGTAVVLDVATGEILAMVNQPAGNPNNRAARKARLQRNRAMTDLFEPGSTLKPFTVAAALETGKVSASSVVDTGPGWMRVGRSTVRDVRDFGTLTVAGVLRKSSNVGISKLALALPEGDLWSLYSKLGFGVSSEIGFPGEGAGYLDHYDNWSRFETATHAFGYGLSVTALQLARAYTAIAADGLLKTPTLIKNGPADAGQRVLDADTARAVRRMMEAVVADDGTAPKARVPGYRVAGKTGTVKKNAASGGYEDDHYLALFTGMAPASAPRLVMVVVIDDPRGEEYYGGQVAAPVFSRVMSGALRLLNVPPDDLGDRDAQVAQTGDRA